MPLAKAGTQVPFLRSSEQGVASHSHPVGIPEAWPPRLLQWSGQLASGLAGPQQRQLLQLIDLGIQGHPGWEKARGILWGLARFSR